MLTTVLTYIIFPLIQSFLAHFAMGMVTHRPAIGLAADPNDEKAAAQSIAFYALTMLIQDVKALVRKGVSKSLKEGENNTDLRAKNHSTQRSKALTQWEKSNSALSWNGAQSGSDGGYASLLIILNEDIKTQPVQLTHSGDQWSYERLAEHLVKMGMASDPTISAPVVNHGAFVNALPIAIKTISRLSPDDNREVEYCVLVFSTMMRKMHIHFLPWHRDGNGRGTPRVARYDCWMIVNRNVNSHPNDKGKRKAIDLTIEEQMGEVATTVASSNLSAPWSVPDTLSQMGPLWKKTVLPEDWDIKHASLSHARGKSTHEYVWKTYEYVQNIFDGRRWQHHMAVVWAILFSRIPPTLFHEKPANLDRYKDPKEITRRIRDIPWIVGTSKYHKGVTAPKPYITMMSTAIIALRDPNSPLCLRAAGHSNALGLPWTDKHGEPIPTQRARLT